MQIPRPIIPTPIHVDMHVRHRVLLPSFVHLPSVSQPWPGGKDQEIRNNLITTTSPSASLSIGARKRIEVREARPCFAGLFTQLVMLSRGGPKSARHARTNPTAELQLVFIRWKAATEAGGRALPLPTTIKYIWGRRDAAGEARLRIGEGSG